MDNDGEWNDEQALMYDEWEKENDYDLPMEWQPNYNRETSEERRNEAIQQQKLK